MTRNKNKKDRISEEKERAFREEVIRPCLCDQTWHRCCIREMIVKSELTSCPSCEFEYSVGYNDCFAICNKKRKNYLAYMLGQEILFFSAILLFSTAAFLLTYWQYKNENYNVHFNWMFISPILSLVVILLALLLFAARIKAKYTYREIEDIAIYDRD